ncbi:MAG TPA: Uma2 family endonuclease [Thermoanaerobaculia bacterium]|nr:Uma2 family endonuclease [Thermoanaerobaculia bacterium]
MEEPLTVEDLLDPRLGDHVVQNSWHVATVHRLFDILSRRYKAHPDVFASCDLKMIWGIRGLQNPAPDIAVIPGVRDKGRLRRSFNVPKEGTSPVLVIEVVSDEPEHQSADHVEKVRIYERAQVAEYFILDPPSPPEDRCRLTGYRLNVVGRAGRYEPIVPDAEGRLLSRSTGLWLVPAQRTVYLFDAATDEQLLTGDEEADRLRAELDRLKQPHL